MKKGNSSEKIVLITGASSGIGKSIANYLSRHNFKVYGTTRSPQKSAAESFTFLQLDVTREDTIKLAVEDVIAREGRLDILINNAGVGITGPLEETPEDEIIPSRSVEITSALTSPSTSSQIFL